MLENRRRLCAAVGLPLERLVVPGQVHGTTLAWVGEAEAGRGAARQPDRRSASTTGCSPPRPGLGLVVSYADCVPVVIVADGEEGPAFATVHAGWRGMLAGIVGKAAAELPPARPPRRRRRRPEHRPVLLRRRRGAAAPVRGPVPGLRRRRHRRPLALRAPGARGRRRPGRRPSPWPVSAPRPTRASSRIGATTGRPGGIWRSPGGRKRRPAPEVASIGLRVGHGGTPLRRPPRRNSGQTVHPGCRDRARALRGGRRPGRRGGQGRRPRPGRPCACSWRPSTWPPSTWARCATRASA